ncbi:MAG TPA: N,N-dimethylformamidase beta subunit family domain-containing protein, partial [Vicinamibacterales bacterium]|nr:N,N-dimethylformamidase beta subunit family domain-containing protein [Vicinamibacterales bacterium]
QAYNQYPGVSNGGASLYCGGPLSNDGSSYARSCATRAAKVSYNRPFDTRAHDPQSWLFNAEYPMVRWLEANGYDVKYQSGVDTDRRGFDLTGAHKPKTFLSVGHDEYWSGAQRQTVENARSAGVSLAFFSGNEMYWKTRYEPSIDGSGTPYRTLVTYKETIANAKIDPAVDPITHVPIWTGTWRDPRFAATTDGGRPENGLIGQIFTINCCSDRIKIPQAMGSLRLWAHTGVSAVAPGDFYRTPEETLGYEWDEDLDNGSRPAGLIHLSQTTLDEPEKLSDFGANVAPGRATHSLTMYRHNSGAIVFGAGTVQWSWGLDGNHDRGTTPTSHTTDQAMQQATVNLLADMGAQPATLQVGDPQNPVLFPATKSADQLAPASTIVSPATGSNVSSGVRITITGTSADLGGGTVAGVEVSVDGGTTWKAATGTTLWSFGWTPGVPGAATIKVRAIDDSGNLELAGVGSTVSIAQGECPCTSIWRPSAVPTVPSAADTNAVELGVAFKSDIDGFITGVRFYKGTANNGTHIGNLWTENGAQLATASFSGETTSGWQQVNFNTPVAITANTVYVASYHTNVGGYAADGAYFATTGVDSPPLHALQSTGQRPNGRFGYGDTQFPLNSFNATNYWVDVVFAPSLSDSTPPDISAIKATTIDSSRVTLTWTTDEPATTRIDYGTDAAILTASIANLPPNTTTVTDANFVTQHSTALTGLHSNTTYYYLITAVDHSGNATTIPAPTFTVPGPTLRDTASADFQAGTSAGGTYVSQTADGELILAPTSATEFTGPDLSPGWTEVPWSPEGYSIIVDGVLLVDGARVASCVVDTNGACLPETTDVTQSAVFTSPHTLEFTANFSGDRFQHAGLGATFASTSEPWAIFSTLNGGLLFARTNSGGFGGNVIDTGLGTGLLGAFHRYKIDWRADSVDYYVDGALVASHNLHINGQMRPVAASDFNPFGGTIFVDWMRMSPYATGGTFYSRIFDAEAPVNWNSIQWQATTPAGTSVSIAVRTGNTAVPDATWSDFQPMSSGGPLTLNSQYIQYRAVLATTDAAVTPALEDIIISTGHAPVAHPDSAIVPENGTHLFPYAGPGSLTENDTDADNDLLRVVGVTPASHGTVVLNADGSVRYTPLTNYSGPDAFTYTVGDGLLTSSATVSLDVRFGNVPPVAVNDFYTINEDATLTVPSAIGVLVNDTDVEHDALTAVLTAFPQHGMLTFAADGGFTYVPTPNYAGPDSFRYKANDGGDDSNEATVTLTVNQVNDPPITVDDAYTAVLNQPLDVPAAFSASLGRFVSGVLANDHDVEVEDTTPMHVQLVTSPVH